MVLRYHRKEPSAYFIEGIVPTYEARRVAEDGGKDRRHAVSRQHAVPPRLEDRPAGRFDERSHFIHVIAISVQVAWEPQLLDQRLDPSSAIGEVHADQQPARSGDPPEFGETRGLIAIELAHMFEHANGAHGIERVGRKWQPDRLRRLTRDEAVAVGEVRGHRARRLERISRDAMTGAKEVLRSVTVPSAPIEDLGT